MLGIQLRNALKSILKRDYRIMLQPMNALRRERTNW